MFSWQTKLYQRFTMTTAVDKWPAYARLLMVARRATYPPLLHHSGGHDREIVTSGRTRERERESLASP